MTIEIKFTGDDPAAIAQQILTVGFLIRANGAAAAAKKEEPVAAVEAETIDPPKKPGRKASAKKQDVIEEAVAEEITPETEAVQEVEAPAEPEKAAEEITPEPEKAEADTPPMTIDELRKYTVGYLTFAHKKLDDQKAEFADLLGQFGVTKIGDLPADKIAAFKALVDERKAKLAA